MPLLQKAYLGSTALFKETAWFEDNSLLLKDTSSATTVTADSTAHTKGAWSQLIASTSANASLLWIEVSGIAATTTNTATLLDIGFGASGSESVKIENVAVGGASTTSGRYVLLVPFQTPSGTRISARIQSVITGGKTATVTCRTYDAGDYAAAPTSVDTIGTSTATSAGTAFVTLNTYVQITASTSQKYRGLVLVPSIGASTGNATVTYTVSKGASGSEVVIGTMNVITGASETMALLAGDTTLIGGEIAAGTRLAVKMEGAPGITNYLSCIIGIP